MLEAVWQGVVELGHGAVQAVQRDGWQQQQRRSGGGGGEEQEKLRSRADAGWTAIKASSRRPPEVLHHSARQVNADLDVTKDSRIERTLRTIIGTERKEITVQAQTGPI